MNKSTSALGPIWDHLHSRYPKECAARKKLLKTATYKFHNVFLLNEALTHRSALMEQSDCFWKNYGGKDAVTKILPWNERLEFLGDSVLSLAISTLLWRQGSKYSEGDFSKLRAALVSEESLAAEARSLGLGDCLLLGKGAVKTGGRERASLLADAFEALIGAVYLDGGYEAAQNLVAGLFQRRLEIEKERALDLDSKTILQEWTQKYLQILPEYKCSASFGPEHKKIFQVELSLHGMILASAKGLSKKKASQKAAKEAWSYLQKHSNTWQELCLDLNKRRQGSKL